MKLFLVAAIALFATAALAEDFGNAAAAFEKGDLATAETVVTALLQKQPDNAAALGLLAAVLDSEKKFTEADSAYRHALRLTPNSATLLNNYANHLAATGDLNAAKATYLKALAIDPSRANANLQLASLAVREKDGPQALHYLEHLRIADRSLPQVSILQMQALYLAGRTKDADGLRSRLSSTGDPRLSFSAGLALASIGRYQDAEDLFSRVLEQVPANFDVLYNLGLASYHARHLERARDSLKAALAQRPNDVDTLYNLAVVSIDAGERQTALELLAEAARLDPSRANVQLSIAQTAAALGYYADALVAYNKYLQSVPKDETAKRERAFMLGSSDDREKGIQDLQTFLRSHPRDVTAHYEVGVLEAQSNPEDAAAHLNNAVKLDPDFVAARLGRGALNYMQGKPAQALSDLLFASAKYPDNPVVLDRLGETYLALDRAPEAVTVLRHAAEIAPKDSRVLLHLSRAEARSGQAEASRNTLARFRALGPESRNLVPAAGIVDVLGLSPEELQSRYREQLQKRLSVTPDDPALNVRYLKLLIADGDLEEASKQAQRLLTLNPPAPLAAEAGRALVEAEQYAQAKPLLEYAASSSHDAQLDLAIALAHTAGPQVGLTTLDRIAEQYRSGDYYLARAEMLDASNQPEQALTALQRGLAGAPKRPDLYQHAALFLTRQHRAPDAVRLLDRAALVFPDDPKILLVKAATLAAVPRPGEAEQVLKQIQNRWPEWAPAYVTYGILLEGQKRSQEAKTQLETAVSLGASGPEEYLYLARATLDSTPDRIDEASKAIEEALVMAPGDPQVQAVAGRIDYQNHNYTGAVQHLTEAIRLRPAYIQARFTLAQAYRALGRKDDAAREAEEFQRLRDQNTHPEDDF